MDAHLAAGTYNAPVMLRCLARIGVIEKISPRAGCCTVNHGILGRGMTSDENLGTFLRLL